MKIDGLSELIRTFDRMSRGLTFEQTGPLEALFTRTAAEVEAKIHVVSGGLKSSAEVTSGMEDGGTWWGQVETTDRAGIFEMGRGGSHYYMAPMVEAEQEFEETAMAILEGMALE